MKNKKLTGVNRSKTRLRFHIIFATKYRRKILSQISTDLEKSFHRSASKSDGVKIIAYGEDGDHVHLVIDIKPRVSVSQAVRVLKQGTTHDMWEIHKDILTGVYTKRKLWSDGYFAETVGNVSENTVLGYVKNQGEN